MSNPVLSTAPMNHPPGVSNNNARPIRRRFAVDGRVRSGCLTCKARKKKCDGQISSVDNRCRSCIRLGLVCEQLPLRRVATRPRHGRKGPISPGENPSQSPSPPRSDAGSTPTDHSQHDGDGDGDGDHDHEDRDDGEREEDVEQETRLVAGNRAPPSSASAFASASASVPGPLDGDGIQRLLLKYFLDNVAPLCSILQHGSNSVCSVLLPMAIVDSTLLHALLIYASAHVDAAGPALLVTPHARMEFESQMARGMSEAITRNTVAESTVACALVASTALVIGGDTLHWPLHLEGAGHLVNHLGAQRLLQTTDGSFLLRYFAYHDIMAALSTGRRPLIGGVYWVQDADATVDSADAFFGLAHHIFGHIGDLCAFVTDTSDLDLDSSSSTHTNACNSDRDRLSRETRRAERIAHALRSQHLRLTVKLTDPNMQSLLHHAEAFRFAALYHLYRRLVQLCGGTGSGSSDAYESHMAECAQQILRHVSLVPLNAYCEMGLVFPLFVAGVHVAGAGDKDAIDYIQTRLGYIETWTKFGHYTRARELLRMLWEKGRTDWEAMVRELGWNISLA